MSLTHDAVDKIKQMLVSGRLGPGDRLPRESDLAAELGISRSSLREAVSALSQMHVLDVRQGDGTYVTSLRPDLLMQTVDFLIDLYNGSPEHLMEGRRALEPAATARAAVLMSDEHAQQLMASLDRLDEHSTPAEVMAADREFHHQVAVSTGNPVMSAVLDSLTRHTEIASGRGVEHEPTMVARTRTEHQAIATAILDRKPEVALSWAMVHVEGIEEWLRGRVADASRA